MPEDDGESSETVLFKEHVQAHRCIDAVTDKTATKGQRDDALAQLRGIFDKYLECPTLLDGHVGLMVTALADGARLDLATSDETSCLPYAMSSLYALSKVRGRKRIQRFLPHETSDVEPVLNALKRLDTSSATSTETSGPQPWESVYVLWIWLEMLSLVPFDCSVLSDDSLVPSIISLSKSHLNHTGPTRETASSCLASWLHRPDMTDELDSFVHWSREVMMDFAETPRNAFLVMGVVQTLAKLVKGTTNRTTLGMESSLWEPALAIAETQSNMLLRKLLVKWFSRMGCAYMPPRIASWRYQRGRRSLLENLDPSRAQNKPVQESQDTNELFHVPDQVEDAMGVVLQSLTDPSTVVRWSAAKGVGRMTERLPAVCADDVLDYIIELCRDPEKDHAWHGACLALAELARRGLLLPGRLGDVVPLVVRAIQFDVRRGQSSVGSNVRDAACYTYWAFARAYSPTILKPHVPQLSRSIVLASLFDREVNCRRAASAAFQECVGRQGADNFKHGIPILTAAEYYSLGNIGNAYTTVALQVAKFPEYRYHIIDHLYMTKLFHWDINIRTLASKSLHGMTPLDPTHMRKVVVPRLVRESMSDNLFVRHGAVLGLAEVILAVGKADSVTTGMFADFDEATLDGVAELVARIEKARLYRGRGGEIMRAAVCRLIECMSQAQLPLTVRQQVGLLDTVDTCLKHPNEDIQQAASMALYSLTGSYFPVAESGPSTRLQKRVVDNYVNIVSSSDNPAETRGFALALGSLPSKLVAPSTTVLSSVLECLIKAARFDSKVGEEADAETRRNSILSLTRLCDTVGLSLDEGASNEIRHPTVVLSSDMCRKCFDSFLLSLEDYNTDRRGDVGSWSRVAAMSGLESLTYAAVRRLNAECSTTKLGVDDGSAKTDEGSERLVLWFDENLCVRIIGALLKQLAEKLDSVRAHAGECLSRMLVHTSPTIPYIPHKESLLEALQLKPKVHGAMNPTNWANAAVTYRMVMAVADVNDFFPFILSGMIISVGGLGESVTKYSEEALLAWMRETSDLKANDRAELVASELLTLFRRNHRERRVVLPLLKTLDMLLSRGYLNVVVQAEGSTFSSSLLECLKIEETRCTDVNTLLAIVSVALGILSSEQDEQINADILIFLFQMLSHRYPRVRRFTADHLYVRLLEDSSVLPNQANVEPALDFLLEAPWNIDNRSDDVRELCIKFAGMVGINMAWEGKLQEKSATTKRLVQDEFANYSSLVNSV